MNGSSSERCEYILLDTSLDVLPIAVSMCQSEISHIYEGTSERFCMVQAIA